MQAGASSRIHLNDLGTTQAKVIVLCDAGTGKSQLIRNLDYPGSRDADEARNDSFFTLIEIPSEELENSATSVVLKLWKHSSSISKQEEELAFRGALFCIVVFDIRNPATADAALNKWVAMKELHAPECFLFIVGTFLDQASHRRVDLKDICKASAKKNAIYVEVSNSSHNNIPLLRKLIKQRLNYMLQRKEVLAQRPFAPAAYPINTNVDGHADAEDKQFDEYDEEKKDDRGRERGRPGLGAPEEAGLGDGVRAPSSGAPLSVPALEQDLLCDSTGSILACCLGTESWPGLLEGGDELQRIGSQITSFLEQLSKENDLDAGSLASSAALTDDVFNSRQNFAPRPARRTASAEFADAHYGPADLQAAFAVLGLPVPRALEEKPPSAVGAVGLKARANKANSATTYLRKMQVRLPDGQPADMILDLDSNIEQQIELFLLSNSLSEDAQARAKLTQIALQVQQRYNTAEGRPAALPTLQPPMSASSSPESTATLGSYRSKHSPHSHTLTRSEDKRESREEARSRSSSDAHPGRIKLRLALPGVGTVEVQFRLDEDVQQVSKKLAQKHHLSGEQQVRVLELLKAHSR